MLKEIEQPLIEAARNGDEAALRTLLEPLSRELHVYAYRMLGGFQDAEDALQDARFKAWRSLATYEPRASFRAWMYRIVTNTCLDMLRTRKRRVLPQMCLTVLTFDQAGRICELTVFVLPEQVTAWGCPLTLDPLSPATCAIPLD